MRATRVLAAVLLCMFAVGCAQMDSFMNPSPTTEGSRVSSKLQTIPPPDPAKMKTITVYRFENKTGYAHGWDMTQGMTDQFITALIKTRHFNVVERAELGDVMTERRLQGSGEASGGAADTQMEGAQLIFAGALTEMDDKGGGGLGVGHWGAHVNVEMHVAQVGLDMRVIDVATSRILDSIDVRREIRKAGIGGGSYWGIHGNIQVSNALDLACRETIEEAVYQLVMRFGAM